MGTAVRGAAVAAARVPGCVCVEREGWERGTASRWAGCMHLRMGRTGRTWSMGGYYAGMGLWRVCLGRSSLGPSRMGNWVYSEMLLWERGAGCAKSRGRRLGQRHEVDGPRSSCLHRRNYSSKKRQDWVRVERRTKERYSRLEGEWRAVRENLVIVLSLDPDDWSCLLHMGSIYCPLHVGGGEGKFP